MTMGYVTIIFPKNIDQHQEQLREVVEEAKKLGFSHNFTNSREFIEWVSEEFQAIRLKERLEMIHPNFKVEWRSKL